MTVANAVRKLYNVFVPHTLQKRQCCALSISIFQKLVSLRFSVVFPECTIEVVVTTQCSAVPRP
jgi:hypothetical protein